MIRPGSARAWLLLGIVLVLFAVVSTARSVQTARSASQPNGRATGRSANVYHIGIFEDPISLNYWNYLGPGGSVWTGFVLNGQAGQLYTLSDQRFDFVPSLAKGLPPEPAREANFWTITVDLVEDALWSDGRPITAHDVAFTLQTCIDLQLTHNWPNQCKPDVLSHVRPVDDFRVRYYFVERPGLAQWQYGVAQAPILPKHFWAETVAQARAIVEETAPAPIAPDALQDCHAPQLSPAEAASCEPFLTDLAAYEDALASARRTLYDAPADEAPVAGGFKSDVREAGAFIQRKANENYYFAGSEIVEYADGTWQRTLANGDEIRLYGQAAGAETLRYITGPHVDNIVFTVYSDQAAAYLAMIAGDVDYVLSPFTPVRGLLEQAIAAEGVTAYRNPDNSLFYLAFNMRKEPFSRPEFREAVEILIDKEFLAQNVLQGSVLAAYATVPPANALWHNLEIEGTASGLTRLERLSRAITLLSDAGWTWEEKPRRGPYDPQANDLRPGRGLRMPGGQPMPEVTILGPGAAYDPQRASFNQWISKWMRDLGMPVRSELTSFNEVLAPVFREADFDMYILGWELTVYPDYLCDFFHGRNDTITSGNFNVTGFRHTEFDSMCDAFLRETDLDRARAQAQTLQRILADERPYIPLFYRQVIDLIRDNVQLPYTEAPGGVGALAGFQTAAQVHLAK